MQVIGRDLEILKLLARFGQASADQVHDLVFADRVSRTPCDRSLRRLVERQYLARIERRTVGGAHGGSGQYVYILGRSAHPIFFSSKYQPSRSTNYHSLELTQSYISFKHVERDGIIKLAAAETEPDCHRMIQGIDLRPDLYIEYKRTATGEVVKLWLEVDMGTEGHQRIKEKLNRYWTAFNRADPAEWPVFPLVVFVAVDQDRADELVWLLNQGPADARAIFRVTTTKKLASELSTGAL